MAGQAPAALALVLSVAAAAGCQRLAPARTQRLVDLYRPELVANRVATEAPPPRLEWRLDGAASKDRPTLGWRALSGIADLALRDGRLVGRTTDKLALLHLPLPAPLDSQDLVHEAQVRLRVTGGANAALSFDSSEKLDEQATVENLRDLGGWAFRSPVVAGEKARTYVLRTVFSIPLGGTRHLFVSPSDEPGARFEIESIRVVTRREHLLGVPSGMGWQGLSEIYKESLVARAPETMRFAMTLPARPWLDLAVGTLDDEPVTFRLSVREGRHLETPVLERTVTRPHRWETTPVDLSRFAGRPVTLTLALESEKAGALGLWGSPVVRDRTARRPRPARGAPAVAGSPPQGVIVIWADTLRRDHLGAYGYGRPTSPFIDRLAREGTLFQDAVSQASWTKVSTPSLMTSLYPTTHGVKDFTDRIPSAATTLAEVYREAGYATVCMSSVLFVGKLTNLHQGFEELHEDGSLPERGSSKTGREYVDRLGAWLEAHREQPFFAFLHVTDPHDPYKPRPPYDTLFAPAAGAEEHERQAKEVKKVIADPLMKLFGMPSRAELQKAGFDPEAYLRFEKDWYDGSIRGMDAEIARLFERLRALGLDRRTLVVFTTDHGEEFFEHGRMFHGQNVYGHQNNVPLILWQPGVVPAGRRIPDTVQSIDVMPTLLRASGLPYPKEMQGRDLWDLIAPPAGTVRAAGGPPAVSEKAQTTPGAGAPPPHDAESYALILGGWKLVHNVARPAGQPEYELYDHVRDPLNLKDLAKERPEAVARLGRELQAWRRAATAARLPPDSETEAALSGEELERLRALGYIQ